MYVVRTEIPVVSYALDVCLASNRQLGFAVPSRGVGRGRKASETWDDAETIADQGEGCRWYSVCAGKYEVYYVCRI